jgi:hypothetical protein
MSEDILRKSLRSVRLGIAVTAVSMFSQGAMAEPPAAAETPKPDAGAAQPAPAAIPDAQPSPKSQPSAQPPKSRSWNMKSKPSTGAASKALESEAPPPPTPPAGGDERHPGGVEHAPGGAGE